MARVRLLRTLTVRPASPPLHEMLVHDLVNAPRAELGHRQSNPTGALREVSREGNGVGQPVADYRKPSGCPQSKVHARELTTRHLRNRLAEIANSPRLKNEAPSTTFATTVSPMRPPMTPKVSEFGPHSVGADPAVRVPERKLIRRLDSEGTIIPSYLDQNHTPIFRVDPALLRGEEPGGYGEV